MSARPERGEERKLQPHPKGDPEKERSKVLVRPARNGARARWHHRGNSKAKRVKPGSTTREGNQRAGKLGETPASKRSPEKAKAKTEFVGKPARREDGIAKPARRSERPSKEPRCGYRESSNHEARTFEPDRGKTETRRKPQSVKTERKSARGNRPPRWSIEREAARKRRSAVERNDRGQRGNPTEPRA